MEINALALGPKEPLFSNWNIYLCTSFHYLSNLVQSPTHPAPNLKASGWVRRSSLLRIHRLFSELYSADLGWTVVKLIHGLGDLEMPLSHLQGNSSSRRHSLAHSALVSMLFT